jgi:hypothetical protein
MMMYTQNYCFFGLCPSSGQVTELALFEGLDRVGVFPHLRMETDPVSEMLCFLVSRILDNGRSPKISNSEWDESLGDSFTDQRV